MKTLDETLLRSDSARVAVTGANGSGCGVLHVYCLVAYAMIGSAVHVRALGAGVGPPGIV